MHLEKVKGRLPPFSYVLFNVTGYEQEATNEYKMSPPLKHGYDFMALSKKRALKFFGEREFTKNKNLQKRQISALE